MTWIKDESCNHRAVTQRGSAKVASDLSTTTRIVLAATKLGELFLFREEADRASERDRLEKEIAKLESDLRATEAKLGNPSFTERAPAAVVEEHRRRRDDLTKRLTQLRQARASLD